MILSIRFILSLSLLLAVVVNLAAQSATPKFGKDSIDKIVAVMSTEEKVALLIGMGMDLGIPGTLMMSPEDKAIPEKVPGAAGRTHAVPRLGIPSITLSDGPAGVRINPTRPDQPGKSFYATGFPVATLLASSWDEDLVSKVGAAFGAESRDFGIDILLAPGMNLHRNPLGGRNFEYYSEDPLVSGKMAAAFVRGVQSMGVGTSIKHFAVNNQEFNRLQSNSIVGERALRELYLRSFEIAVKESRPWTVMSSYNLLNGRYTSQEPDLLDTVLRKEWGFGGVVMTDWLAGNDVVEQMIATNELIMPGLPNQSHALIEAVNSGRLDSKILDRNVASMLRLIEKTLAAKDYKFSSAPDLKGHSTVARQAAASGMVLLKNDTSALPLKARAKVGLFGNGGYDMVAGGTGSGNVNKAYVISPDKGLVDAGFTINSAMRASYLAHIKNAKDARPAVPWFMLPPPIAEMDLSDALIDSISSDSDIGLIVVGRNSGEFADRTVAGDFDLTANEQSMIGRISKAFRAKGKKLIAVLNVGGPIELGSWRDQVDAILLAWQPGQEGGYAIIDTLSGRVNPSGKLATTFPMAYTDVPSADTFPGRETDAPNLLPGNPFAGKPSEAIYTEGIFVGYRYYSTQNVASAYDFGHGLSYTNFTYSNLRLGSKSFSDSMPISLSVKNVGKVDGREVAQVYVSAPAGPLSKPVKELRAFAKTRSLKPGESHILSFTLTGRDLASFDPSRSAWIAYPGKYCVQIGTSSIRIEQTECFDLPSELVVEKVNPVLKPKVNLVERPFGKR
ncbi:MAG: glycoside hydrolase family 3 C-terminal domain-containing protein [bacterium]|nr:glycoside hydrolase family 3 C-terminal domain-containing protein [bacterium]